MTTWQYFPKSSDTPAHLKDLVNVFIQKNDVMASVNHDYGSNEVLSFIAENLELIGYQVEKGKTKENKIKVPVLYGENGKMEKSFDADAYHKLHRTVVEVEAGRALANNQFLKDLFQACIMDDVDYLAIAVRETYHGVNDFQKIKTFFDTLYVSNKLKLPLKGILLIGY